MRLSTRCNIQFTLGLSANYFSLKSLSLSLKSHMLRCQPWLNLCINLDNFIRRRLTDHKKIISPILRTTVAKIVKINFTVILQGNLCGDLKQNFSIGFIVFLCNTTFRFISAVKQNLLLFATRDYSNAIFQQNLRNSQNLLGSGFSDKKNIYHLSVY